MQPCTHFAKVVSWLQGVDITMKDFNAFQIEGDAKIGHIKSSPKNIYLKTCSSSFTRAQSASLLSDFHPELCSGGAAVVGSCSAS